MSVKKLLLFLVFLSGGFVISQQFPEQVQNTPENPKIDEATAKELGNVPTPPVDLDGKRPTLLGSVSQDLMGSNSNDSSQFLSDDISIMSSSGGLLTLWSLRNNQWVWGYTPKDSIDFGDARIWKVITHKDGKIQLQNKKTKTCLSTFAGGVVHIPCDSNDPYQLWTINVFDNQAVQLKNIAKQTCLETPTSRGTYYYSIFTTTCTQSGQVNLDQQWYFTAPAIPAEHVFNF